jgi:uncharacterized protein
MPSTVTVRFYAELNDFLPPERRQVVFRHSLFGRPTVKDLIESLGVPHTEVDLILADGRSVDFSHRISDGEFISVFPVFESFDISTLVKVRPKPLREPRFVLDTHLGKLASYLRMLGFDTLYNNSYDDKELAGLSAGEGRILLTRDRGLLKRSEVTHGYLVRSEQPREQVEEVLRRFDLIGELKPFRLCLLCNRELRDASAAEVENKVPPRVWETVKEYKQCPECSRVYWQGTHYRKMAAFVDWLREARRSK